MGAVIGLIIGAALGSVGGTWYWSWIAKRQNPTGQIPSSNTTSAQIEVLEQQHEQEMSDAIARFSDEQDERLERIVNAITKEYEAEIEELEAKVEQPSQLVAEPQSETPVTTSVIQIEALEQQHEWEMSDAIARFSDEQDERLERIVNAITKEYEAEIEELEAKLA